MLSEALDKVFALVKAAQTPTVLRVPGKHRTVFLQQGRDVTEVKLDEPLRGGSLRSVDDFAAALLDKTIAKDPEVYVDDQGAVAFVDRNDRREVLRFPFVISKQWQAAASLEGGRLMKAKEAISFLRFQFPESTSTGAVIDGLRRVDFTRNGSSSTNTQHGKESLGRSVEAAVQQADKIPEEFSVEVAPLLSRGLRSISVRIRLGIVIDFESEAFMFRPMADQLEAARESFGFQALETIRAALPDIPVFEGSPALASTER